MKNIQHFILLTVLLFIGLLINTSFAQAQDCNDGAFTTETFQCDSGQAVKITRDACNAPIAVDCIATNGNVSAARLHPAHPDHYVPGNPPLEITNASLPGATICTNKGSVVHNC